MPNAAFAAGDASAGQRLELTDHWVGTLCLVIFAVAYALVIGEERIHLRKSKPVILAAGAIWAAIGWVYTQHDIDHVVEAAFRHNLLEYAELMLFLLVAMTYINAMEERRLFDGLRVWLVKLGLSYRALFWLTGVLSFFISPIADNLTTALLMCAVVLALGASNTRFVNLACINIVVAANAGGAFSPFGDITTLMVWQKGLVSVQQFLVLFLPSVVNFLIPAAIMTAFLPNERPEPVHEFV
ncbi:MAG: sodium:proton antiporter NhaD, partial [Pseudomonadota bacterium]